MAQQLTIDTNLAWDLLEPRRAGHVAMLELLKLADEGQIELVVTRRIEQDVPRDPLASRLQELGALGIGSALAPMRFDVDCWDQSVFGSQDFIDACAAILAEGWRPTAGAMPDWRDQDHLHTHVLGCRDVFLTRDAALREFCTELRSRGQPIDAMTPEEYIDRHRGCNLSPSAHRTRGS